MSKKTATIGVVLLVAIVAFGLAYVVADMVGTYSFNLFNEDNSTNLLNNTTQDTDIPVYEESQQSDSSYSNVKTEDVYVSDSGSSGSSESSGTGQQGPTDTSTSNNDENNGNVN